MGKLGFTPSKYICAQCGNRRRLVVVRGRAVCCQECYETDKMKKKAIRELNKLLREVK